MQPLLDWLAALPPAALYLALAVTAAAENIFPPLPADTVVAFGSFLAARGHGTALGSFLATWLGNIAGAMGVYWLGRRYGSATLMRRVGAGGRAEDRVRKLYGSYGLWALFLSRFLPGVRAVVPPFAGALRIPAVPTAIAMASASAMWYGTITYLAFRVGTRWEDLVARIGSVGRTAAIAAAAVVTAGVLAWVIRKRRA